MAARSWRDHLPQGSRGPHRLILVRGQDVQHSGSGCCGRLGEAHTDLGGAADYRHSRVLMQDIGAVYREVRARLPELAVEIVDPRNTVWLYPAVWQDARAAGRSARECFAGLRRAGAALAVILDGEVLFSGRMPQTADVVAAIEQRLSGS